MNPHEPSLQFASLRASGGQVGPAPEDFTVDELPAYEPSGEGEHLFVRVRKRLRNTTEVAERLARAAGVDARDVGYAGMKDRHAVTTQWFSLPKKATDPATWDLPEGIDVVEASRHANKLRTGHLRGNRFGVRFVDVVDADALEAVVAAIAAEGMWNTFGPQRFGRDGGNLELGMRWLRGGADRRDRSARFYSKMLPSVVQSEIFNRFVEMRVAYGVDQLLLGEWVRLNNAGAGFTIEDVAVERPRLLEGDLVLTGPLPGERNRPTHSDGAALESAAVAAAGLTADDLTAIGKMAPGARRDLFVHPTEVVATRGDDGSVLVSFVLPPGAYASQLIREVTRLPWKNPFRAAPEAVSESEATTSDDSESDP